MKGYVMFNEHPNRGTESSDIDFLENDISSIGEMKELKLYVLKESSEHITPNPRNEYILLPYKKMTKESHAQPSGGVPQDKGLRLPIVV